VRDARRTIQIAVLKNSEGKLNDNQRRIIVFLEQSGGRARVEQLRELPVPRTTLATLVKRGLIEILEEPADFSVTTLK
jgi:primosomal protein N' (replication factor Y)